MTRELSDAARVMGRKGGLSKSARKVAASRKTIALAREARGERERDGRGRYVPKS